MSEAQQEPQGELPLADQVLGQLLEQHAGGLRAFVRLRSGPMLRSLESTSDLVQSVCREVLLHRDRFRFPDQDGFRHWLYTMAARKIANRVEYWHAQKRDVGRLAAVEEAPDLGDVLRCYRSFCSPTGELRTAEEIARIEGAFSQLPEHYREVITLSRIAGLSNEAVARELGRSEDSVRMLLFRALARLALLLERPNPPAA